MLSHKVTHALLEVFMTLHAQTRIGMFRMSMITYVEEYVDDDGLLDTSKLLKLLTTLCNKLRKGETPLCAWMLELKRSLRIPELFDTLNSASSTSQGIKKNSA